MPSIVGTRHIVLTKIFSRPHDGYQDASASQRRLENDVYTKQLDPVAVAAVALGGIRTLIGVPC